MSAILNSINVSAPIAPNDTTDTFALFDSIYAKGSLREVADIAERDNISSERLSIGMIVYVLSENKYFKLISFSDNLSFPFNTLTNWEEIWNLIYVSGDTNLVVGGSGISITSGNFNNILVGVTNANFPLDTGIGLVSSSNRVLFSDYPKVWGVNNLVIGDSNELSGVQNHVLGFGNDITGIQNFNIGYYNYTSGNFNTSIGVLNSLTSNNSNIIGGFSNAIISESGNYNFIIGGFNNLIALESGFTGNGNNSVVGGWTSHIIGNSKHSAIINGIDSRASGYSDNILGGLENKTYGNYNSVVGGAYNFAGGQVSTIIGGTYNGITGNYSLVLNGRNSSITADNSTVIGRKTEVQENHEGAVVIGDGQNRYKYSSGEHTLVLDFNNGTYIPKTLNSNSILTQTLNSKSISTEKQITSYRLLNSNFNFNSTSLNLANSATAITGTLPAVESGLNYIIKNINVGSLLITGASSLENIDGFSNATLLQYDSAQLVGVKSVNYTGWITLHASQGIS